MLLLRELGTVERAHRIWITTIWQGSSTPTLNKDVDLSEPISTFVKLGEVVLFCRIMRIIGTQIGSYKPLP